MNSDGLSAQAKDLAPHAQAMLGLLLTWLLSPLLFADETEEGRARRADSLRLLDESVHLEGPDAYRRAAAEVASVPELQLDVEPDGPAAYRVDLLAALLYALRAGAGEGEALRQCLTRVGDSLDFAANEHLIPDLPHLDDAVLAAIATLMDGGRDVGGLRPLMQAEYDAIAAGIR